MEFWSGCKHQKELESNRGWYALVVKAIPDDIIISGIPSITTPDFNVTHPLALALALALPLPSSFIPHPYRESIATLYSVHYQTPDAYIPIANK
jgi:hypothetical protein